MKGETEVTQLDKWLYHIAEPAQWLAVGADYVPTGLVTEGFVHLSRAEQVLDTAQRYYAGRTDLLLLTLERSALPSEIRHENLAGGTELFPHHYGVIPRSAVLRCEPLLLSESGFFSSATLSESD